MHAVIWSGPNGGLIQWTAGAGSANQTQPITACTGKNVFPVIRQNLNDFLMYLTHLRPGTLNVYLFSATNNRKTIMVQFHLPVSSKTRPQPRNSCPPPRNGISAISEGSGCGHKAFMESLSLTHSKTGLLRRCYSRFDFALIIEMIDFPLLNCRLLVD